MKNELYLGIDTSNYTTSAALVDGEGNILCNAGKLLPVREGERGLRQSDAVFAHVKNLPGITEQIRETLAGRQPVAVGVSCRPCARDGSYMPCFLTGEAAASTAAAALGVPLYRFSHQCGHLAAAITSCGREELYASRFGAFHVSGGTTEVLTATYAGETGGFTATVLGGSADLHAGQVIDRVGIMLGLSFPCGKELEKLADSCTAGVPKPHICVRGCSANLSGLENQAEKLYRETKDAALVAAYVLDFIAETLVALTDALRMAEGPIPILYAGGVMSDIRIRKRLSVFSDVAFADPALSTDNAVGIADLCRRRHRGRP